MGVERDRDAREVVPAGMLYELAHQVLVAAMNAVEFSDRDGAGAAGRGAAQLLAGKLGGHGSGTALGSGGLTLGAAHPRGSDGCA